MRALRKTHFVAIVLSISMTCALAGSLVIPSPDGGLPRALRSERGDVPLFSDALSSAAGSNIVHDFDRSPDGLRSDFPNSDKTGVPVGTTLIAYAGPMMITQDGVVIEGKIINGSLRVTGDNVVVRNSRIVFDSYWGIDAENAGNITIQDCDIEGPGYSADSNAAILGSGTFLRNDISRTENGIVLTAGSSVVKGNYIHDLEDGTSDSHYDGIAIQGGQNGVLIQGNTVIARDTSNIIIQDYFGPVNDVTIDQNYLGGNPGINVYVEGRFGNGTTNVRITNNHLERGSYDTFSIVNSNPLISGNIELRRGSIASP